MRIIGFDPGIAIGKPVAIVAIDDAYHPGCLMPGDDPTPWVQLLGHAPKDKLRGTLWQRYKYVRSVLRAEVDKWAPDLVAIEDSRGVGGRGHALQTLVELVQEWCAEWGVPCVTVNPQTIRAAYGKTKQEVANNVHLLLRGADKLPRGRDWTDACAVALCGPAAYRLEGK